MFCLLTQRFIFYKAFGLTSAFFSLFLVYVYSYMFLCSYIPCSFFYMSCHQNMIWKNEWTPIILTFALIRLNFTPNHMDSFFLVPPLIFSPLCLHMGLSHSFLSFEDFSFICKVTQFVSLFQNQILTLIYSDRLS